MYEDGDPELAPLVGLWLANIDKALQAKEKQFGAVADEGMRFFHGGDYSWMYNRRRGGDEDGPLPSHQMVCNKVAEMVQLFGPVLYHRNPTRQVNPRQGLDLPPEALMLLGGGPPGMGGMPPDPMVLMQAAQEQSSRHEADKVRAQLLGDYLNYTPRELGLSRHARCAVDEAIIKGRGLLWVEAYQPPESPTTFVGSFFDSVDDLAVDPDMESIEECYWIARRCVHPTWEVERIYGLPEGSLKDRATIESQSRQVATDSTEEGRWDRKRGKSNDLMVYWKVYSRMGAGGRLPGCPENLREPLEQFGDHAFLVLARGIDYPLNLPPHVQEADVTDPNQWGDIQRRVAWPIPTYVDGDSPWPVSFLDFHDVPRSPWPMSHLKPGLGELKFLNWAYSYLAGRVRTTCRQFVAVPKDTEDELIETVMKGEDLSVLKIPLTGAQAIGDIVQVLKFDNVISDLYTVIEMVERSFEKRMGLNDLMYGAQPATQDRSAAQTQVRTAGQNVRPDAMADRVEAWMGQAARKEALAARLFLQPQDVQPVLGPVGSVLWGQLVSAHSPAEAAGDLEFTIESGSIRKPNRDRDVQNSAEAMQVLFPPLFAFAQSSGMVGPVNALLLDYCKARDIADPGRYQIPPPPPPPMLPPPGPGGPPGAGGPPPGAMRPGPSHPPR